MKNVARAVAMCCCLFVFVLGHGQAGAVENYSQITDQQLIGILTEEGFSPKLTKPNVIAVKMEGRSVVFFVSEGNNVQAYAGFKSPKASLNRINTWNKSKRYSRAYMDDDGDPVIELDLDLAGGVTKERIADYIRTVSLSVSAFAGNMVSE